MEILSFLLIISCIAFYVLNSFKQYRETQYYQITKNSYFSTKADKGKYGEYLTYKALRYFEDLGGKFLFNVYIPKSNGGTTEIDVVLICTRGIFVIESKNYSGWIFGNESHRYWTQTLPRGRGYGSHKERFYNPILQNAGHIKHLKRLIGDNFPIKSIIVFSDECTLKNIKINNSGVKVINRRKLSSNLMSICNENSTSILTYSQIESVYNCLYPFTQIHKDIVENHIDTIQKMNHN